MEIDSLLGQVDGQYFQPNRKEEFFHLHAQRDKILKHEEETLRLKNKVVWLDIGDNNTTFFHRFSNQRKITNSIWELKTENGEVINDQKNIKEATKGFFKDIYRKEEIINKEK